MSDFIYENSFSYEANAIELLGYAQNDIVEAKSKLHNMPQSHMEKLSEASSLLREVSEYLYSI